MNRCALVEVREHRDDLGLISSFTEKVSQQNMLPRAGTNVACINSLWISVAS